MAVDDARVFAVDGSVGVQALDRETGEQVWATDVTATDTTGIDIQPVIAGTSCSSLGPREHRRHLHPR